MKRSWLIGAALLFSLSAVACSDDSDTGTPDSSTHHDAGPTPFADGGMDGGGANMDSGTHDSGAGDAGDAGH